MEAEDKTNDKTNRQSLGELLELRLRIAELEETEARRQRVDKALRLSEKYFRTLIENTLDVITMLDKDGVITYQSPSMGRVLGYGEEELLGKNVLQYIHPDDSAMIVENMALIVDSPDDVKTFMFRFRCKDGSWCDLEGTGKAIIEGSELIGIIMNSRDISKRRQAEGELRKHQEHLEELILERTAELEKTNYLLHREIGERKQAQNALQLSEDYYRSLVENAFDFVSVMNVDSTYSYMSPSVEKVLGYSAQEMLEKDPFELIHTEDVKEIAESFYELLSEPGGTRYMRCRVRHKDGSWRYCEGVGQNLIDHSAVAGIVVNIRDITDRKLAEEAIRTEKEFTENALNSLADIFYVLAVDGKLLRWNRAGNRILGYSDEELSSMTVFDFFEWDDVQRQRDFFQVLLEKGQAGIEGDIITKSGELIPYYFYSTLLKDKEGNHVGVCGVGRDITERKRMEESLKESEKQYRDLVENINDVIFRVDAQSVITYISPAIEKIGGYTQVELVGRSFIDYVHPDDLPGLLESMQRTLEGELEPYEFRVFDKDGKEKYVRTSSRPVIEQGQLTGLAGVLTDITERKKVEEALQRSEGYFRSLIENALDIITVLDDEGNIIYESPSAARILGYEPGEFLGKNVFDFINPEDVSRVIEIFLSGIQTPGTIEHLELRFAHADGSWRYLEVTGYNLLDDPSVAGVVVNARDITQRKIAEEAVRESEEFFRSVTENLRDMIIILSSDGTIRYASPSIKTVLGYEPEVIMDKVGFGFVHQDDLKKTEEALSRLLQNPDGSVSAELRAQHNDGSWRVLGVSATNLLDNPIVQGIVINSRDITERMRMEEELKRREEHFRSLIENSLDVIVAINREGIVDYVSPSIERVLGFKPEEVLDDEGLGLIHPDDLPKAADMFKQILDDPSKTHAIQLRVKHKDGSWRDIDVNVRNYLDHPSVKAIVANYRDITDRKLMRERLESINHLFLSLGVDLIANMERIVEAARYILGGAMATYSRMEKRNYSILSTAPGEDSLVFTERPDDFACFEVISRSMDEPLHIRDLEDSEYWEKDPLVAKYGLRSYLGYPVKMKQRIMGCLSIFFKEHKEFSHDDLEIMGMLARSLSGEEERLSHEESLKDFIDIASHELRHPITLMKGYALTMRENEDKISADAKRHFLGIINEAADRLSGLVRELLDVSRIERGRFSIDRQNMRLKPLFDRAVEEMREKGCQNAFHISLSEEAGVWSVDPEKLISVLVILMDNAVTHSPNNSDIEVVAESVDGELFVSVLDRGKGVPEKERELVFERFYQVEDTLHHSSSGMGLGLYIAKEIVEGHGGKIWCEPREGGGSAFRFTIP